MVFSRLFFIYLFFPICFLCYFATKKTSYRNAVLIVFFLLFYACGDLSFLGQGQVGTELFHIPAVRFIFPHHHFRTYRTV